MDYTIKKLANLAGISTRTLRYYDEIKLLCPIRSNSSNYRIYTEKEVDLLQQIMFYKELGMDLFEIKKIISSSSFHHLDALYAHLQKLGLKKQNLDLLINNVTKTIQKEEGRINMLDTEKFEGFKQEMLSENESKYGKEIREKYGNETVEKSNKKFMNLSKEDYNKMNDIGNEILKLLETAVANKENSHGKLGQEIAKLHKEWLSFTWNSYTKDAHIGLVNMYVEDERFTAYYDKNVKGCAMFLKEAVEHFIQSS